MKFKGKDASLRERVSRLGELHESRVLGRIFTDMELAAERERTRPARATPAHRPDVAEEIEIITRIHARDHDHGLSRGA